MCLDTLSISEPHLEQGSPNYVPGETSGRQQLVSLVRAFIFEILHYI